MSTFAPFGAQRAPHDPGLLARQILSEPRFRLHVQAPPARTWWDVAREWIADRWAQLIDALSRHVHLSSGASVALGDVLLVLIVLLVVLVAARLLLNIGLEGRDAVSDSSTPLVLAAQARDLCAAARRAAEQGAYASAIALIFQAALATFDARGLLRNDPARTVNECRRDVRVRAPRLHAAFEVLARAFTAAVYAEDRVAAEDWAAAQRAYEALNLPQSDAA